MSAWRFTTVTDLTAQSDQLAGRSHGWIDVADGRLVRICLRPWPRRVSQLEVRLLGGWRHQRVVGDRCRVYFNHFRRHARYLSLPYATSTRETSWATIATAIRTVDRLAEIRRIDATVCEVVNDRVSDRLMLREGWEPHLLDSGRRHWIKRFYGQYPSAAGSTGRQPCASADGSAPEPTLDGVCDETVLV